MQSDSGLERKFCQFGDGLIEGYASLFGVADQGGDVVAKGAYTGSLTALAAQGRGVKMLWQHDASAPIGVWDEVREDERGLYVKGRLLESVALIEAGALDGLSIGYRTKKAVRGADGKRNLQELELWEVSLVTFPMLPSARVGAKADTLETDQVGLRALAGALRDAAQDLKL